MRLIEKNCNVCRVKLTKGKNWGKHSNFLCREHFSEYTLALYHKNKEKYLARTKEYFQTDKGKSVWRKASLKSRKIHPERWEARTLLNEAVRRGLLEKMPCQVCGKEKVDGHHYLGYDFPYIVIWLCRKHHILAEHEVKNKVN